MAGRRVARRLIAAAVALAATSAALGVALADTAVAAPTWWTPTPAAALPLHWVLDTGPGDPPIDVNNPWHVGERSLSGAVLPAPAVLDIDGDYNTRDTDPATTTHMSRGVVETLHARGQKAICYLDAGVQEMNGQNTVYDREAPYRFPTDRQAEQSSWGGYWLDFTGPGTGTTNPDPRILAVIEARIVDWCVTGGFDAVEFDEVDYWENKGGQGPADVTYASQLAYNRALFGLAHSHNLAAIHKGDIAQIRDLEPYADATLNEEAAQYREALDEYGPSEAAILAGDTSSRSCTEWAQLQGFDPSTCGLRVFSSKGKAVWNAEYRSTAWNRLCTNYQAVQRHWNGSQYVLGLPWDGGREPCPGSW